MTAWVRRTENKMKGWDLKKLKKLNIINMAMSPMLICWYFFLGILTTYTGGEFPQVYFAQFMFLLIFTTILSFPIHLAMKDELNDNLPRLGNAVFYGILTLILFNYFGGTFSHTLTYPSGEVKHLEGWFDIKAWWLYFLPSFLISAISYAKKWSIKGLFGFLSSYWIMLGILFVLKVGEIFMSRDADSYLQMFVHAGLYVLSFEGFEAAMNWIILFIVVAIMVNKNVPTHPVEKKQGNNKESAKAKKQDFVKEKETGNVVFDSNVKKEKPKSRTIELQKNLNDVDKEFWS